MAKVNKAITQSVFLITSAAVGLLVYLSIKRVGTHLVVNDAHLWGVTSALFIYASQFLLLVGSSRKAPGMTYATRLLAILIFGLSVLGAGVVGSMEVKRGYPSLTTEDLVNTQQLDGKHFAVEGEVNIARAYTMAGDLGAFVLVPVTTFNHRILMMLPSIPTAKRLRATGKLRSDIRTVQRSQSGAVEGPFLQVYREDMRLEENVDILFLDTSSRVGLNFGIVLWFLVSFYLLIYFIRAEPSPLTRNKMRIRKS